MGTISVDQVSEKKESRAKDYWDRIADRTKGEGDYQSGKKLVPFRNWIAEYADAKAKEFVTTTFERSVALKGDCKILDVGCGPGKWSTLFSEMGFWTIGVDSSDKMIDLAEESVGNRGARKADFSVMDASLLGFRDATFDFVNCVTVLQHILTQRSWKRAIEEIARVVKPCGYVLLYEIAPSFALVKNTESLHVRTLREYTSEFARAGAQLVLSVATDISFPLTVLGLRRFSTSFNPNDAYFYWGKKRQVVSSAQVLSFISKLVAKTARKIDYGLATTPLGIVSPTRILLFKKRG
jgi:ubiquinone/menaquinone biosynthesis C-methylase UbiE